jgi:hypothetical protein
MGRRRIEEIIMQKAVIEYGGEPVGIVVPEGNRLKFIAVKFHVHPLDEQRFDSPEAVTSAIRDLMGRGRPKEAMHA